MDEKEEKENGRRTGFWVRLHPILFFYGDTRDSWKYDTFRGKLAVLFINLLGKGLTQEINGDGGSCFSLNVQTLHVKYWENWVFREDCSKKYFVDLKPLLVLSKANF